MHLLNLNCAYSHLLNYGLYAYVIASELLLDEKNHDGYDVSTGENEVIIPCESF
jgi:hypothetical protein